MDLYGRIYAGCGDAGDRAVLLRHHRQSWVEFGHNLLQNGNQEIKEARRCRLSSRLGDRTTDSTPFRIPIYLH